jgi:hypothetical protein
MCLFDTKSLSNFQYESLVNRYESPVKFSLRKLCQTLNTKALLFSNFYTAFVTDCYELIPSRFIFQKFFHLKIISKQITQIQINFLTTKTSTI